MQINLIPHRRQLPNNDEWLRRLRLMTEQLLKEIHVERFEMEIVAGLNLNRERFCATILSGSRRKTN